MKAEGGWRLYFDQNDDGAVLPSGAEGLEILLKRITARSWIKLLTGGDAWLEL